MRHSVAVVEMRVCGVYEVRVCGMYEVRVWCCVVSVAAV